ncbi:transcriptional regulator BetI [Maritimibacter sp. DP1N21-5]|uniref:choline-binding transcriptional repressor BetI n=1 Tax=Maritimibacter sp. DP1N21-5 TaxID=2836867 RepID=UPI001C45F401|nr:transcriptional regulator BetI [Maritimibacter sp. DP1N21-5]MBV7409099.1 transcriptional regulator BetI [Maritimibacter sp. DP1N21-5]
MPKVGMEPIRREALVKATIAEIGAVGSLDVTVSRIAKRAGMSSALAHHYFGSKDQIFLAAMRYILTVYGEWVVRELARADGPRARLSAIVRASFETGNFEPEVVASWLNFYVHAQSDKGAARLLAVYHRRLRSNLMHDLRPLVGLRAGEVAEVIGALIDGVYLRHALGDLTDGELAAARVIHVLNRLLEDQ